jgi:hypothetical protein
MPRKPAAMPGASGVLDERPAAIEEPTHAEEAGSDARRPDPGPVADVPRLLVGDRLDRVQVVLRTVGGKGEGSPMTTVLRTVV